MIEISELYLIQTVDKSPHVFISDPTIFNSLVPSTILDLAITEMILDESEAGFHLDECFKGYFEYDVNVDFESGNPRVTNQFTEIGTPIYNYKFILKRENDTKVWSRNFKDETRYFASHNWQIIYKSKGDWFICYAEFSLVPTLVNNNVIQPLIFESKNSKEEIYSITNFGIA